MDANDEPRRQSSKPVVNGSQTHPLFLNRIQPATNLRVVDRIQVSLTPLYADCSRSRYLCG
jgi:hypothetical protein